MNLFDTVVGWFRPTRHKRLHAPGSSFQFTGKPTGDVAVLEAILCEALRHDRGLRRAYLTTIRYDAEEIVRVALCLDTSSAPQAVIRPLADHCAQYVSSIDIIFFSDFGEQHIEQLTSVAVPFYVKTQNA